MNAGKLQGLGIAALSRFAQSDLADQLKLRKPVEKILYRGSKAGFQQPALLPAPSHPQSLRPENNVYRARQTVDCLTLA